MSEMPDGKRFGWVLPGSAGVPRKGGASKPAPLPRLSLSPSAILDDFRESARRPPSIPMITVGDQTYREIDNGQAGVLVPINLRYTPAELAAQRLAMQRALYQAAHPIGTIVSGGAGMVGASQRTRDAMLLGTGSIEDAAPLAFGRGRINRVRPPSVESPINITRPKVVLRPLNQYGQATGATASLHSSMSGKGTKASRRIKPVGYVSSDPPWNHDKSHLIANRFGGSGKDGANLMTLERRANQEHMSAFEDDVARRVRAGEAIDYSVTPLYANGSSPPSAVLMSAFGHREGPRARLIRNPAGPLR